MQTSDPKVMIKELYKMASKDVGKEAIKLQANFTTGAPVDKGWLSNNFVITAYKAPTKPVGTRDNIDTAAAAGSIINAVTYNISLGPLFVTNNVPYATIANVTAKDTNKRQYIEKALQKIGT